MDHYCPWTGNVVGFRNHKFFLLLGLYGVLVSLFAVVSPLPELVKYNPYMPIYSSASTPAPVAQMSPTASAAGVTGAADEADALTYVERHLFFSYGIVALLVCLLLTCMLISHFPLALRNLTSIEEVYDNMPNPYYQPHWCDNLEQILGIFGPDWFFPVMPARPLSDGYSYKKTNEVLPEGLVEEYEEEFDEEDKELGVTGSMPEKIWLFRYTGQVAGLPLQQVHQSGWWPF
eukprot:gnl/TRDRNA2_/TRDRNA2_42832_c1_seq1.p1 gnl/TRDRNA2_/TRDRNA2_42832_c1~~gnl/TRDRNA2_/TRDRNA2_42832_c1_seq1.p1  ORF type:complete len:232 (+),score=25.13 gnl/TRDRNA2_/TRDRNA2_42832_c1_seq1:3-698(+)